jgi:hypothetical protein
MFIRVPAAIIWMEKVLLGSKLGSHSDDDDGFVVMLRGSKTFTANRKRGAGLAPATYCKLECCFEIVRSVISVYDPGVTQRSTPQVDLASSCDLC